MSSQIEDAGYDYTQGGYTFACNTTLPDMTFSTNGYDAVVPGEVMTFGATDDGGTIKNIFGDPY